MIQLIGTIVCIAGIAWLFYLDRELDAPPSRALWIPTIWLLICGSRSISEWLAMRPTVSLAQQYSESSPIDAAFYAILIFAGVTVLNFRAAQVRGFLRQNLPFYFSLWRIARSASGGPITHLLHSSDGVSRLAMW